MILSVTAGIASKNANIVEEIEVTWESFCQLPLQPDTKPKEEHPLIYPAQFKDRYRKDMNCLGLWCARLDVDQQHTPIEVLQAALAPYKACAWTSFSSTPEFTKWGVWVLLEHVPATRMQYKAAVEALVAKIPGASPSQHDTSRARVAPVARPGFQRFSTDGAPLALPAHYQADPVLGTSLIARGADHADFEWRRQQGVEHCQTCSPGEEGDGGNGMFIAAMNLVRRLELPLDVAFVILRDVLNPRAPYLWDEDLIVRKVNQARDTGGFDVGGAPEGMQNLGEVYAEVALATTLASLQVPEGEAPPAVFRTESGNAELYHFFNRGRMLYVQTMGWLAWDGSRWAEDVEGLAALRATAPVIAWLHAHQGGDVDDSKAAFKWAMKTEERKGRQSMVALAKAKYGVRFEDLDADPWLFNVANGVLDLRTAALLPASPERLITKQAPVAYDENAQCPRWRKFLHRICNGDLELVAYMQRFVGYCLTGSVEEQMLSFFYGNGSNGKSTLTLVLQKLFGDYACSSPGNLLLARSNDQHPTAFADLRGIRFTVCQETEQGKAWDESLIKQLTGTDIIRARRMHKDFFEFRPSHKIIMSGNHKPTVKGVDKGIWRRIKLVPFAATIEDGEKDKRLLEKLIAELPGILNWALEGCLLWQTHGLGTCQAVDQGTEEYRQDEDVIEQFLEACALHDADRAATRKELYQAYEQWNRGQGELPMSTKAFTAKMVAKGATMKKIQGERYWVGIRLRDSVSFGAMN